MSTDKLELTEREVEAIIDYVFMHVRATNGLGKRVYEKMLEFLEGGDQASLFD